jgi:hypothetical protein
MDAFLRRRMRLRGWREEEVADVLGEGEEGEEGGALAFLA